MDDIDFVEMTLFYIFDNTFYYDSADQSFPRTENNWICNISYT